MAILGDFSLKKVKGWRRRRRIGGVLLGYLKNLLG